MLRIDNLVKRFGKFYALNDISININKGEIYGFVGPNGAGKTTTMKIVAGLLEQTDGSVYVNGIDITKDSREYKRLIGYMPDFFGVYDDLKVCEYLDFYCGIQQIPNDARAAIIARLLELVKLTDKNDTYVNNLSRGMKQRLCLARTLIHDPQLLILDEPASGLDPRARFEMKEILKDLSRLGKTILISSHILPELAEICTSVGIIQNGKMVASGTVDEIMQAISGKKKYSIKVINSTGQLINELKVQPSVKNVNENKQCVEFEFGGNDEEAHLLLYNLISHGHSITSFAPLEENLETVFMHISGGVPL